MTKLLYHSYHERGKATTSGRILVCDFPQSHCLDLSPLSTLKKSGSYTLCFLHKCLGWPDHSPHSCGNCIYCSLSPNPQRLKSMSTSHLRQICTEWVFHGQFDSWEVCWVNFTNVLKGDAPRRPVRAVGTNGLYAFSLRSW